MSCTPASPNVVLRCDKGSWTSDQRCRTDQRCDRARPRCADLGHDCFEWAADAPICDGPVVIDCGPEQFGETRSYCPFGCRDGVCEPGRGENLTIHTGVTGVFPTHWEGTIPVCLGNPNDLTRDALAWVRSEVESVYNRYLNVEFSGWGECAPDATGVILTFAEGCRDRLVNDLDSGNPGEGRPVHVEICDSYFAEGAAERSTSTEPLIRLLARHQFGHVLGLLDGADPHETVMVRGVDKNRADEVVVTEIDYMAISVSYGYYRKHRFALASPLGQCLGAKSADTDSGLEMNQCNTSPREEWVPSGERIRTLRAEPSSLCIGSPDTPPDPGPVELGGCQLTGSAQTFRLKHASWRTPIRCVAPLTDPPEPGTRLVTETCASGNASQSWYFEIVDMDESAGAFYSRIHFADPDPDYCVTAPRSEPADSDVLELQPCAPADKRQLFWLGGSSTVSNVSIEGEDEFGEPELYCVNWQRPDGVLALDRCTQYSTWLFSGALENDDGLALTVSADGTVVLAPLESPPSDGQTFDYYF